MSEEPLGDGDPIMFQEQLRNHFLRHSSGSSINLSFDGSSSTDTTRCSNPASSGDAFREQLLQNPRQLGFYIREKLRYHFMSPLEKWQYRKVFPWKMIFQIIKIFTVTTQILLFGFDCSQFYSEQMATETALKAYFLKDWDPIRDVYFYPPDGPYAVYTEAELFDQIDTAVQKYSRITEDPIGSFRYKMLNGTRVPPRLCLTYYNDVHMYAFNATVRYNNKILYQCLELSQENYANFSIVRFLNNTKITLDLQRVIMARLDFAVSTVYRRQSSVINSVVVYQMEFSIVYDNNHQDGVIEVKLNVTSAADSRESKRPQVAAQTARQIYNVAVIAICLISLILCSRSIYRCYSLLGKTVEYFKTHRQVDLCCSDKFEFVDLWLCLIMLNDILVISGTVIKMSNEMSLLSQQRYLWASVLLGTGLLFVWCGVLRYLGYFRHYNVLMLTLKKAAPNLLKFLICALILFMGYSICGWVVLGPHHIKFRKFSTSLECLYAITNGDDIFATFALATNEYSEHGIPPMIWWFLRIYFYSFVTLFICVVINLLYAVIIDAFDTIKEVSDANLNKTKSIIHEFIDENREMASSGNFLLDDELEDRMSVSEIFLCCFPWFLRDRMKYVDNAAVE
ncbi:mucolipin-3-like isoform X2 [Varroa destructor]|nr:mucolipin-3-like isoform X2 [Varroa destructor]